jgi:hypothetical protein
MSAITAPFRRTPHSGPPTTVIADEPGATMRKHRRTAPTVSNNPPLDNFNPCDALESLHTDLVQLEAFAHAAGEAVTHLPHTSDPKQRWDFTRLYALVSKVANDAAAAASHGDQLIAALSSYLDNQRTLDDRDALDA